jgi:hypothetical protein
MVTQEIKAKSSGFSDVRFRQKTGLQIQELIEWLVVLFLVVLVDRFAPSASSRSLYSFVGQSIKSHFNPKKGYQAPGGENHVGLEMAITVTIQGHEQWCRRRRHFFRLLLH